MQTLEDENQNFTDGNHSLRDQLSDKEEILRKVKEEVQNVMLTNYTKLCLIFLARFCMFRLYKLP